MLTERELFTLWRSYVFRRNRHPDFDLLLRKLRLSCGVYLIGCAGKIIYVGQSVYLKKRSIQSLGKLYYRVPDFLNQWSIAFAPCHQDELNERESTAIRAFAPDFNTSIPSEIKSRLRMPEIIGIAPVFMDQDAPCGAFDPANMEKQMQEAAAIESASDAKPTWKPQNPRKITKRVQPLAIDSITPDDWTKEDSDSVIQERGTPVDGELPYRINLCNDGSVITRDGEVIGTWQVDELAHPSFIPVGAVSPLFYHPFMPVLCHEIAEWHERTTGETISHKNT